jgi:hypothetical protein
MSSNLLFAEFGGCIYHLKIEFYGSKKPVDRYYFMNDISGGLSLEKQHAVLTEYFNHNDLMEILLHYKPLYFKCFIEENQSYYVKCKTIKSFKIIKSIGTYGLKRLHELSKSGMDTIMNKKCYFSDYFTDPRFDGPGYSTSYYFCYNPKLTRKDLWKLYNKYAKILCTTLGLPNSWDKEKLSKEELEALKKYRKVYNLFRSKGVFLAQEGNPC